MVSDNEVKPPEQVNASPTKNFFVEMLTRDIDLEDSILDLLDNCVGGKNLTNRIIVLTVF